MQVVELLVVPGEAELAADALWQAGATAVSEEEVPGGRVLLRADVADPAQLGDEWRAVVVEPDSEAHLDAWRAFARPHRIGHVVLQPSWLPEDGVGPDALVLRLDPGRAFGSGSHPSTRLVLTALVDLLRSGDAVLDVGCGSGVLAIAAARLGAGSVTAIDVDPAAVESTVANAERNEVVIVASTTPVEAVDGAFDLVLANIGVVVLVELAPELATRVRPGGHVVLAGLLEHQADAVADAFPGWVQVERPVEDGWAAVVLRRA